ncbi:hypothetical protein EI427_00095 [Flammeovirga pectinis]|uniref:Right-handed parallel beta-helix repeat-containing protein n=1 Tax=Flammeovirga pectinis TaxID=2494373 RepID=A0A3S9NXH3_9BACT|nr:hypothetical protein [Flammeovirga pectinis]AZQ60660.1 hypothetical protein EI427_00095 [Flammeovirga pectinis]
MGLLFTLPSCEPTDEVLSTDPSISLIFSQDTVFFDTLYTSKEDENIDMSSIAKRFTVYNPSGNAINISEISLNDPNDVYSLLINGDASSSVENTFLRGGDSMIIVAEANIPYEDESTIREFSADVNLFTNGNKQNVVLNAFGEDPYYIAGGNVVIGDLIWDPGRTYLLIDSLYITEGSSLTINAGARLVFDNNAKIQVSGSLQLLGTPQDTICLESKRLDGKYENSPGQWGGVIFDSLSHDNKIYGSHIKNSTYGLYIYHPDNDDVIDLDIQNSTIHNVSLVGVSSIKADVRIVNTIISHTVSYAFAQASGGVCEFLYNTIVNENTGYYRDVPSVAFESILDNTQDNEEIKLTLTNNIIWGSLSNEFNVSDGVSLVSLTNNIIKTTSDEYSDNNILNQDPYFRYPYSYNFSLADDSPARGKALSIPNITIDQIGNPRTTTPDIGALQWVEELKE